MAKFRQNTRLPSLEILVFTSGGPVNFPVDFPGGVTYRMVGGGVTITGPATGDSLGRLVYNWNSGDLAVAGTYVAYFIGVDGTGRSAAFPTGTNLEIIVVPTI
jgi:hypothetical protein